MPTDTAAGPHPTPTDSQCVRTFSCQWEEDEVFQPISAEELGPSLARKVRWLNALSDDVVGRGVEDGWMSREGLRTASQKDGYGRYFRFRSASGTVNCGDLFLCMNFQLWATRGDTPLWLWISESIPVDADRLQHSVPSMVDYGHQEYNVPIYLTTGVEY